MRREKRQMMLESDPKYQPSMNDHFIILSNEDKQGDKKEGCLDGFYKEGKYIEHWKNNKFIEKKIDDRTLGLENNEVDEEFENKRHDYYGVDATGWNKED